MKTTIDETLLIAKVFSFALLLTPLTALAQPSVIGPYTLRVFANGPSDIGATKPDSVTFDGQRNIWVSFTNGVAPDGSDGKSSTVVEYNPNGAIIGRIYSILGSNDGLKYNPCSKTIWALRNQDANPALTVIDPRTQSTKDYTYAQIPAHGGGFDDVVFLGGKKYISASNPTLDPQGLNPAPSILSVKRSDHTVFTTPVLSGDAFAINRVTGQLVQTVQTDPDSMTIDRFGNLVLDSQADSILLFVSNPGTPAQSVSELPLTDSGGNPVQVDDTVFPSTSSGTIYFTDSGTNTIYALQSDSFDINVGYSSSGPSIGTVNLSTGLYTPIVTGLTSSHGATFVSADPGADNNIFQTDCLDPSGGNVGGNISTRASVQTGADVMIGGFIISGSEAKTVIVRAIGPELTQFGVPNPLADPALDLHDSTGRLIASNNNWQTTVIGGIITSDQVSAIQNSGHAPTQPSESAIIATLQPGNYTAIVRGVNNTTGVALVEVDDLQ